MAPQADSQQLVRGSDPRAQAAEGRLNPQGLTLGDERAHGARCTGRGSRAYHRSHGCLRRRGGPEWLVRRRIDRRTARGCRRGPTRTGPVRAAPWPRRLVREGALPCIAFGVVDAGAGARCSRPGPASPAQTDSIFFIASVTKAIVATAVMQYVDEGRLRPPCAATALPAGVLWLGSRGRHRVARAHAHVGPARRCRSRRCVRERPSYRRLLDEALARVPAWPPGSRYAVQLGRLGPALRDDGSSVGHALRRRPCEPDSPDRWAWSTRPSIRATPAAASGP